MSSLLGDQERAAGRRPGQVHRPNSLATGGRFWGPILIVAIAATILLATFFSTPPIRAEENDMDKFLSHYPHVSGTRLDSCDVCHREGSDSRNAYGSDYKDNGRSLSAVEHLDSDGDGFDNLAEITALTFPGDPGDFPAPSPTPTPDLIISKRVVDGLPAPGGPVTFTLALENAGTAAATGVVVSDILSNNILSPTWTSSMSLDGISARHGLAFVWDLPDLAPGASGFITISGQLNPGLAPDFALINIATISTSDEESDTSNNRSVAIVGGLRNYLPAISK